MKQFKRKIVGDTECPKCVAAGGDRTSNHLILFDDGSAYCSRCEYSTTIPSPSSDEVVEPTKRNTAVAPMETEEILTCPIKSLVDRGIRKSVAEHYGVRVGVDVSDGVSIKTHFYPMTKDGKVTGFKQREITTKQFRTFGECKGTELFGQSVSKYGGKNLYITEGECDAMALYQILTDLSNIDGWTPQVVSLPHGASASAQSIATNLDFIDSFEKVTLVFDQDEPGMKAAEEVCQILPGKTYIAKFALKDANDMLLSGKSEELKWDVIKHARRYQPDNIVNGKDLWNTYLQNRDSNCMPYPENWTELNEKTYGVRPGSIITIASGSGCGKTQFMRELKYHFFRTTDYKFADIALEEGLSDTLGGLMALHLNQRIHLPDVDVPLDVEKQAFEDIYSSGRWELYDHFGGLDDESLFSRMRFLAAIGCKVFYLDHLSIIVSEFAAEGSERERIDTIMTKLAKLAKELDLIVFLIVHLRKVGSGRSFEEGERPSLDDLRGSGSIKQLSWDIIFLSRNLQHPDKFCSNTSLTFVGKCRFTGRTGDADYLYFNGETGRMVKVDRPEGYDLQEGKKKQHKGSF